MQGLGGHRNCLKMCLGENRESLWEASLIADNVVSGFETRCFVVGVAMRYAACAA